MHHPFRILVAIILNLALAAAGAAELKIVEKLKTRQPVKIVCLGDSVTGIYYHTGGRRAYPEMLEIAVEKAWPGAEASVVNAGISGNTTADGLRRLEKDVLDHKPDLVTVMFGLNDMVRVPIADFEANLGRIIQRCREVGAEVVLCTPNSVIDSSGRPVVKLVQYCDAMKRAAGQHDAGICDVYSAYEAVRSRDPLAWRLLLSDPIHPNMDGHKLNAETICLSITGREVSLASAGPPRPAIPKAISLVREGKPVRVLAMPPYDKLIGPAMKSAAPTAVVEVKTWPTAGQTLAQIEAAAGGVRGGPPDLAVIAVPLEVTPDVKTPAEEAIHAYQWVFNLSLSFGLQQWDVVGLAPSVLKADLTPEEKGRDEFARRMIQAQDLSLIARPDDNRSPPEKILEDWLREQFQSK